MKLIESDIAVALKSFPAGSAGGLNDSLRHGTSGQIKAHRLYVVIKIREEESGPLLLALFALRRLVAKSACRSLTHKANVKPKGHQLGFNVLLGTDRGGCSRGSCFLDMGVQAVDSIVHT